MRWVQNKTENWKNRVTLRKYKVKAGLIEEYINKKDWATILKIDTESRLNAGRGMLAEFLAYFYLWRLYKARLVEFHKEGNDTDVDVIAEDNTDRFIVQAKNSLTVDRKKLVAETDGIITQFAKVEKTYGVEGKTTRKILFVIDWAWDMDKAIQVEDWNAYIFNTGIITSRMLRKGGVDLVIYSKEKMWLETGYEDFIKKINDSFDITEKG